jgi:hypothetical protein
MVMLFQVLAERTDRIVNRSLPTYLTTGHTTTTGMLSVLSDTAANTPSQYLIERIGRPIATYPLPAETWRKQEGQ